MRKPQGYGVMFGPDGVIEEHDTRTCAHCNTVHKIYPRMKPEDMGGLCKICMGLICSRCVDLGCTPFEKKLEMVEAKDRALRSYGM